MLSSNRQIFQGAEKAIGKNLSFLSPNSWTFLSILLAVGAAYFLAIGAFILGAFLFSLAALCDAVDGAVARYIKKASSKGAYLDTIVDRYVEFLIIAGLFLYNLPSAFLDAKMWLLIYLFGSVMTTYAKAAAKEKDIIKVQMTAGLIGRAERLVILFIGLLLAAINPVFLAYDIALLGILTNITALQRISLALRG